MGDIVFRANTPEPIPIPSPTQRPVFRTTTRDSSEPNAAGPSTRPARKRPFRAQRSLPSQLSNLASPADRAAAQRSASMPNKEAGDGGVLDDLLDRAFKTFSVQLQPKVATGGRRSLPNPGQPGEARSGAFERQLSGGSGSSSSASASALGSGSGSRIPPAPVQMARTRSPEEVARPAIVPTRKVLNEQPIKANNTRPRPAPPPSTKPTPFPHPQQHALAPTTKSPPTGATPGKRPTLSQTARTGPRVGLSSRPAHITSNPKLSTTTTSTTSRPLAPTRSGFKPPFLQQPAIRCSPRGQAKFAVPAPQQTPSKTRAGAAVLARSNLAPPLQADEPTRNAPSSDSAGDESFDSFDGMFQAGGEDVEALMRATDGR